MRKLYTTLVLLSVFLLGCQSSPQKSYYLLTPLVPAAETQAETINELIGLGPIELAEYLQRPNMVRMGSDNKLKLNSNDFWGEALDKGIVRVMSLNLTRLNPARMIQPFPWRSDRIPAHSFRVYIHELVLSKGEARINATWELINNANKNTVERQHFIRVMKTDMHGQAMAHAYSQLLADMSEDMHTALLSHTQ